MGDIGDHETPVFEKPLMRGPSGANVEKTPSSQKPRNMNGPLYMQTAGNSNVVLVRRTRRKEDSGWKQFVQWLIENQIGMSLSLPDHGCRRRPSLGGRSSCSPLPFLVAV